MEIALFWSLVALGLVIFSWTRSLFGTTSAYLALFLYALSPTTIAHAHLVTTDLPAGMICAGNPCRPIKPRESG